MMKLHAITLFAVLVVAAGCGSQPTEPEAPKANAAETTSPESTTSESTGTRETDTTATTTPAAPESSTTAETASTTADADIDWAKAESILKGFAAAFQGTETDCAAAAATIEKLATDNADFIKQISGVKSPKADALGKKYMGQPAVQEGIKKCMADKAFGQAMMKLSGR